MEDFDGNGKRSRESMLTVFGVGERVIYNDGINLAVELHIEEIDFSGPHPVYSGRMFAGDKYIGQLCRATEDCIKPL